MLHFFFRLQCIGNKQDEHECNDLPLKKSLPAILLSVDFKPRDGHANKDEFSRNKFSLHGSYYNITCGKMLSTFA